MNIEIIPADLAPEPNITTELCRMAIREIAAEQKSDLVRIAALIPVDPDDLVFWMSHEHIDRPWFRHINREVERFAAQWEADRRHKNRNAHEFTDTRLCRRCGHERAASDFYIGTRNAWCKACMAAYQRERYRRMKESAA